MGLHVAADVGTSSIKVVVVDERGYVVRSLAEEIPLILLPEGGAEHDLEFIGRKTVEVLALAVKGLEEKVESIALTTYLHGLALLDRDGRVLQNVMTHLDTRASAHQRIVEEFGGELYRSTGCPPIFVYPLVKLLWLKDRGFLSRAGRVSFVKDYIIYKLSGYWALDYGVASGTGLFDVVNLRWSSKALEVAGIDETLLPELVESARVLDYIDLAKLGLRSARIALVPGTFDGGAQNLGFSVYESHAALNLGSTAVVRLLTKRVVLDRDERMRFFAYYTANGYRAIGGASNNGMTFLEWLREKLVRSDWGTMMKSLEGLETTTLFVLPFVAGERFPFRDPFLRFTVVGGSLIHDWRHLVLASFEAVGFTLRAILDALKESGLTIAALHASGGGAAIERLVKTVANVLSTPVVVYGSEVSRYITALGAVATALRALGYVSDVSKVRFESVEASRQRVIEPDHRLEGYYRSKYEKFLALVEYAKSLYRSLQ